VAAEIFRPVKAVFIKGNLVPVEDQLRIVAEEQTVAVEE
jgi:hypothetical protein